MFEDHVYDGVVTLSNEQRIKHYQSVLTPRSDNQDFLLSLPNPQPLSRFIAQTRQYLVDHPLALIGEVGLDKSFRIPEVCVDGQKEGKYEGLTPGGREGRRLSPYRVSMGHQKKILLAQLRLAGEMGRAVSVHGVQAHGVLYEALSQTWKGHEKKILSKKELKREAAMRGKESSPPDEDDFRTTAKEPMPYPPRICLHSYSGPPETIKQYTNPAIPCEVFFSFSILVNFSNTADKSEEVIRAIPGDRILVESDLHTAGDRMDGYIEQIVRKVCEVKEWSLEDGVQQLSRNWKCFVFGR